MKLTEDVEDSTPPLDCVGAKLPPVIDSERGASHKESLEQSDETRSSVAGASVILKGLSTVQYNARLARFCPRAQRQHRA